MLVPNNFSFSNNVFYPIWHYLPFKMHFKMSSTICFYLDQSKILSSGNELKGSLGKDYIFAPNHAFFEFFFQVLHTMSFQVLHTIFFHSTPYNILSQYSIQYSFLVLHTIFFTNSPYNILSQYSMQFSFPVLHKIFFPSYLLLSLKTIVTTKISSGRGMNPVASF